MMNEKLDNALAKLSVAVAALDQSVKELRFDCAKRHDQFFADHVPTKAAQMQDSSGTSAAGNPRDGQIKVLKTGPVSDFELEACSVIFSGAHLGRVSLRDALDELLRLRGLA
jgi:hypothetical protein